MRSANILGGISRQIALHVDDGLDSRGRVELAKRLVDPVRAGGMLGARQ